MTEGISEKIPSWEGLGVGRERLDSVKKKKVEEVEEVEEVEDLPLRNSADFNLRNSAIKNAR